MIASSAQSFRLVTIETRFEALARRPGGVPRSSAIATAKSNIETVAPEHTRALAAKIESLEKWLDDLLPKSLVSTAGPFLDELYELRDISATIGFPSVALIADALCKLLDRAGGKSRNAIVSCFVRSLSLCMRREYRETEQPEVQRLVANLKDLTAKELSRRHETDAGHPASCTAHP